jgi:hypothetical protein
VQFKCVEHLDLAGRHTDVHYDNVADRFELKREERTAFALTSGQITSSRLDITERSKSSNSATRSGRSAVGSVHASGAQSSAITRG